MSDAVIEYRDEDTETVFRWHGGAYIDVGYIQGPFTGGVPTFEDAGEFQAQDVINVWNMAGMDGRPEWSDLEFEAQAIADKRTQGRPFRTILELFEDRCRQYLAQSEDEEAEA